MCSPEIFSRQPLPLTPYRVLCVFALRMRPAARTATLTPVGQSRRLLLCLPCGGRVRVDQNRLVPQDLLDESALQTGCRDSSPCRVLFGVTTWNWGHISCIACFCTLNRQSARRVCVCVCVGVCLSKCVRVCKCLHVCVWLRAFCTWSLSLWLLLSYSDVRVFVCVCVCVCVCELMTDCACPGVCVSVFAPMYQCMRVASHTCSTVRRAMRSRLRIASLRRMSQSLLPPTYMSFILSRSNCASARFWRTMTGVSPLVSTLTQFWSQVKHHWKLRAVDFTIVRALEDNVKDPAAWPVGICLSFERYWFWHCSGYCCETHNKESSMRILLLVQPERLIGARAPRPNLSRTQTLQKNVFFLAALCPQEMWSIGCGTHGLVVPRAVMWP